MIYSLYIGGQQMEEYKITTGVAVGYHTIAKVRQLAKAEDVSVSEWIRRAIAEKLDREAHSNVRTDN